MTAPTRRTEQLPAVPERTRTLDPALQAEIERRRLQNQVATQIRGTMWGKDLDAGSVRAVAEYCRTNGLDAVRHVEILGGRIYLTAEFYRERGAPLVRAGVVRPEEPDMIHADPRLDELAKGEGEVATWAKAERDRRTKLRITYGVPEAAKAAAVIRLQLTSGATVIGVNWCGGLQKRDPVGDAEPTKTAITRAERRAWRQVADVLSDYGHTVRPIELAAEAVSIIEEARVTHREHALLGTGTAARDAEGRQVIETEVMHLPVREADQAPADADDTFTTSGDPGED